jgi:hypothetical protein
MPFIFGLCLVAVIVGLCVGVYYLEGVKDDEDD